MLKIGESQKQLYMKTKKDIIKEAAGTWSDLKETGVEYERRMRNGWKIRLKKQETS